MMKEMGMRLLLLNTFRVNRIACGAMIALMVALGGCGGETSRLTPPQTYKVRGTVVDHLGQPVTTGDIQFRSIDTPGINALIPIAADGSFEVQTAFDGKKLPGTVPGKHEVTYFPKMSASQSEVPIAVPTPVIVQANDENAVSIALPRPR